MCGAYSLQFQKPHEVYDEFGMHLVDQKDQKEHLRKTFNARPGQGLPVVTNENHLVIMGWGLLPSWANEDYKYKSINARAETVAEKPSFKNALKYKRCIIPASGFYEPDKITVQTKPYPWYYFELKDRTLFGLAGLYDIWKSPDGKREIKTFTIITTEPNELVGKIHDRMPVILEKEDEALWLNPDSIEPEKVLPLLRPYPAEKMRSWRVGDEARNPKNDNPTLIEPIEDNALF
jgi:putative SOS response-associated peptidase YedK